MDVVIIYEQCVYSTCDVRINASCYFCDLFLLMGEGYAPRHPEVSFLFLVGVGVGRGEGFCVWYGAGAGAGQLERFRWNLAGLLAVSNNDH